MSKISAVMANHDHDHDEGDDDDYDNDDNDDGDSDGAIEVTSVINILYGGREEGVSL